MPNLRAHKTKVPRSLHPGAWWVWALGLGVAASRTTNPLLLVLIVVVVAHVVAARRGDAPWSRGFKAYFVLALVVIGVRVAYRMLLDGQYGEHVLFTLPEIPLPSQVQGVRLGGPVSAEGMLAALYDGLRLAALLLCVGAANVLADPKRLLKAMPGALHEAGVAVTVALTVAPQLVESAQRVRRARKLRREHTRRRALIRTVLVPVLMDALDRSLLLAAAMDSRGYGRTNAVGRSQRALTSVLVFGGLIGLCAGAYGLLDASAPRWLGIPMLVVGAGVGWTGMVLGGRRVHTTRYRPDPWRREETAVALTGAIAATVVVIVAMRDPLALASPLQPLQWPVLPWLPALGVAVGVLPAWLAPPVERTAAKRTATRVLAEAA